MRRRLLLAGVTLFGLVVLIPLSVVATVAMGINARHWSGVQLTMIT
jgi:hypothetical protein